MPLILRLYEHIEERLQAEGLGIKMVAARGPMTLASWLVGVTPLMMGVATDPGAVTRLLEVTTTTVIRWLQAQLDRLRQPEGTAR